MTIYLQNRDMIAAHNARFEKGEVSYSIKMNQFGDISPKNSKLCRPTNPKSSPRKLHCSRLLKPPPLQVHHHSTSHLQPILSPRPPELPRHSLKTPSQAPASPRAHHYHH